MIRFATVLVGCALAYPTLADPCKAIPDRGPLPKILSPGKIIAGPVVYVGDGDSLCVDVSAVLGTDKTPETLVEVRLADFYAPELREVGGARAKVQLERLVLGRRVSCVAQHRSYDRIVARCVLRGVSVGDLMRSHRVEEGGNGRR